MIKLRIECPSSLVVRIFSWQHQNIYCKFLLSGVALVTAKILLLGPYQVRFQLPPDILMGNN